MTPRGTHAKTAPKTGATTAVTAATTTADGTTRAVITTATATTTTAPTTKKQTAIRQKASRGFWASPPEATDQGAQRMSRDAPARGGHRSPAVPAFAYVPSADAERGQSLWFSAFTT